MKLPLPLLLSLLLVAAPCYGEDSAENDRLEVVIHISESRLLTRCEAEVRQKCIENLQKDLHDLIMGNAPWLREAEETYVLTMNVSYKKHRGPCYAKFLLGPSMPMSATTRLLLRYWPIS